MNKFILLTAFVFPLLTHAEDSLYNSSTRIVSIPRVVMDDGSTAYKDIKLLLKDDNTLEILEIQDADTLLAGKWTGTFEQQISLGKPVYKDYVELSINHPSIKINFEGSGKKYFIPCKAFCFDPIDVENLPTTGIETFSVLGGVSAENIRGREAYFHLELGKEGYDFHGEMSNDFRSFKGFQLIEGTTKYVLDIHREN